MTEIYGPGSRAALGLETWGQNKVKRNGVVFL